MRELVPEIRSDGIVPSRARVRAQALHRDGRLVEDFYVELLRRTRSVPDPRAQCPSPAATASLEIARSIADQVEARC
jgi:L-2-hydroxyglutarate oxidase